MSDLDVSIDALRILTECHCEPAWTERKLHHPDCHVEDREDLDALLARLAEARSFIDAIIALVPEGWGDEAPLPPLPADGSRPPLITAEKIALAWVENLAAGHEYRQQAHPVEVAGLEEAVEAVNAEMVRIWLDDDAGTLALSRAAVRAAAPILVRAALLEAKQDMLADLHAVVNNEICAAWLDRAARQVTP
jgi:hypothetical protein